MCTWHTMVIFRSVQLLKYIATSKPILEFQKTHWTSHIRSICPPEPECLQSPSAQNSRFTSFDNLNCAFRFEVIYTAIMHCISTICGYRPTTRDADVFHFGIALPSPYCRPSSLCMIRASYPVQSLSLQSPQSCIIFHTAGLLCV